MSHAPAAALTRAGARVLAIGELRAPNGERFAHVRARVRHAWDAARFLEERTADDAATCPKVATLAETFRADYPRELDRARALLAFVQGRVRFRPERPERFQSARATLALGFGDCDDSARLLVALARRALLAARFAYLVNAAGNPVHVFAELRVGGQWLPAETTIPAWLGEDPRAAAVRLGAGARKDLRGRPVRLGDSGETLGELTLETLRVRSGETWRTTWTASGFLGNRAELAAALSLEGLTVESASEEMPGGWPATLATSITPRVFVTLRAPRAHALPRTLGDFRLLAAELAPAASPPGSPTAGPLPEEPEPSGATWKDDAARTQWAAAHIARASAEPLTPGAIVAILSLAALETGIGRHKLAAWNFGAVTCGAPTDGAGRQVSRKVTDGAEGLACKPGCELGSDRTRAYAGDPARYFVCWQGYPSALAGWAALVRQIRVYVPIAVLNSGDLDEIARALYHGGKGYYGTGPATPERAAELVRQYAAALKGNAATVEQHLGQPPGAARPSSLSGPRALAFGIGAALVGAAYARRKGWL